MFLFVDFHTNGMYKVGEWENVNWISLPHVVITDPLYRKTYSASFSHITEINENLSKNYNVDSNGETIGKITVGTGKGASVTVGSYCRSVNVMGNTFEGNNGLPSESNSFSEMEQKINSELLGNWLKNNLNAYKGI